jgi:hypothetical protein
MPATAAFKQSHDKLVHRWSIVLAIWVLVWSLAAALSEQATATTSAEIKSTSLLLIAEPSESILLQSLPERQSAQLFLHPKQQPIFELVFAPTQQALLILSLLLPVLVVLAWYIRAGPRRSFRLGLWHDANLCCKNQLYH